MHGSWYYLAHIIKDVFNPSQGVIVYGKDHSILPILASPEFGVEAWGLYSNLIRQPEDRISNWPIGVNDTYFGFEFCELLVSVDYNPRLTPVWPADAALATNQLVKTGGKILLINSGEWTSQFGTWFRQRFDLEKELRRYTMLSSCDLKVYQK